MDGPLPPGGPAVLAVCRGLMDSCPAPHAPSMYILGTSSRLPFPTLTVQVPDVVAAVEGAGRRPARLRVPVARRRPQPRVPLQPSRLPAAGWRQGVLLPHHSVSLGRVQWRSRVSIVLVVQHMPFCVNDLMWGRARQPTSAAGLLGRFFCMGACFSVGTANSSGMTGMDTTAPAIMVNDPLHIDLAQRV